MLVFPYDARRARLLAYVRTAKTVRLFTNDVIPTASSSAGDFEEPDASTGYVPLSMPKAQWRADPVGMAVRAISAIVRFTLPSGRAKIFGHFGVDVDGTLLWSERFDEPFEFLRQQDALDVRVVIDSVDLEQDTAS